jgi:hypothetical protein
MFGEHLEKRLKQMASDMIEACGKRYRKYIGLRRYFRTFSNEFLKLRERKYIIYGAKL